MDEFKSLSKLFDQAPHRTVFKLTLEELYGDIKDIVLNDYVPERIRQHFDTARNLALYSWFVYSFTAMADLQAFACLEFALRERIGKDVSKKMRGLKQLMDHAIKQRLVKDIGFQYWRKLETRRKQYKGEMNVLLKQIGYTIKPLPAVDPQKYSKQLSASFPMIRNLLAHGRPMIWIWDTLNLRLVADFINQLYSSKDNGAK